MLFFQEHRYLFVKLTTYLAGSPQKRRPRRLQTADRADHADCADRVDHADRADHADCADRAD